MLTRVTCLNTLTRRWQQFTLSDLEKNKPIFTLIFKLQLHVEPMGRPQKLSSFLKTKFN